MTFRLDAIAPDLAQRLRGSKEVALRRVAGAASGVAISSAGLLDPRAVAAQRALLAGTREAVDRESVDGLTKELDEEQWTLQERAQLSDAAQAAYLRAFAQARAASALWFALDDDPLKAAQEAVYEAQAAASLDTVRAAVDRALGRPAV
jgi:hypothetical protein